MNGAAAKAERKEARRVLGERTTSIVGAVREHVGTIDSQVETVKQRLNAQDDLIALLVTQVGNQHGRLDRLLIRLDDDRRRDRAERSDVSHRLDDHRHAGFVARLRWLILGG